ncbi:amino acid permease [Ceratobasidium sp. AG-Ba]|nr:amino acid permease [Ceratobasidium sp. AG-Ba]QRW04755.1 amino acid permease [Ceratobasidium sp. AG-Ba]
MSRTPLLAATNQEEVGEEDQGLEATSFAPIEEYSPLGYNVGLFNATLLNTSAIIGTGIFSTSSLIFRSLGSVGMLLSMYVLAPLVTCAGLMIYIELASMCGHKRSGAEVVYLEQAYPKPKYLVSIAFAITTVLSGYTGIGATVFAKHVLQAFDIEFSPFRQRAIAIGMLTTVISICLVSSKWALRLNNIVTFFKAGSLVMISLIGLACALGLLSIPNSGNLKEPFAGSKIGGNALATSFAKVNFSYVGWNTVLTVMAEIKGRDPVRTARRAGFLSIFIASTLYITTVLAFVVVMTKEELADAGEVLGARFLRKVYGDAVADKLFLFIIGMSTFGGSLAGTTSYARMLREVGRQGVLPFDTFWSKVSRFKTPYGPIMLKFGLSLMVLLITPANDAFSFLVDLASYPGMVFALATACGVWILRRRRREMGLPAHAYQVSNFVVGLYVMKALALLIMPWIPPKGGSNGGDVDFFYATYCIVGIGILLLCGLYYWTWFKVLPKWFGYDIIEETVLLPGGAKTSVLRKRYKGEEGTQEEPLLHGEPLN